jgi:hypothetical protein
VQGKEQGVHVADETVVDEGSDTPVLEQTPGVLRRSDVGLSVQGDFDVGVT